MSKFYSARWVPRILRIRLTIFAALIPSNDADAIPNDVPEELVQTRLAAKRS
ncbi:MAG: hypothetical protein HOI35_04025 [Woeseia sp.]|nr:hypothetical protein [Woeseia sp.]MBT6209174.1 hypothetical protein [Woeseia sp.]